MASLPLSISSTITPAFFRNNPRRGHGLTVSCNAGRNVDRRDLLLGMGGLCGATNLVVPDALADPIATVQDCGKATYENRETKEVFEVECCPKTSDGVVDYTFPEFKKLRVRPAAHRASTGYIEMFEAAIGEMKKLPSDDPRSFFNQANVHCAYCNDAYSMPSSDPGKDAKEKKLQIHKSWFFFPWHRWYLYFYERILGKLIGEEDTFALPFWNWDNTTGMEIPPMFANQNSTLSRARRDQKHFPRAGRFNPVDLSLGDTEKGDPDLIAAGNVNEMHTEMNATDVELTDFYGAEYRLNSDSSPGQGAVERGSHTAVHIWCGDPTAPVREDMGNFYSAGRDPLFFSHHANVDRLWTVWRGIRRSKGKPTEFTDSDWLDTSFLFYDENARLVRVKVRDCVDAGKMGYTNEAMELPWLNNKPKARTKKCRVAFTSNAPNATDPGVFPVTLDKVVRVLVDRPKKRRSRKDKEKENELLVIDGIKADSTKFVRFEVFVNDEDDEPSNIIRYAEYAGAYSQVPHKSEGKVEGSYIRLGLTELLEELDVEDDDKILVSLVPRAGGKDIIIGGVKIVYV